MHDTPEGPQNGIAKVSYTHDAMIDLIISAPMISQKDLAAHFGYTQGWVSLVMSSDAFKERLEARRKELVDPLIAASLDTQLEALCRQSMNVLAQKLELPNVSADVALKTLEVTSRAKGYGAARGPTINLGNFVVAMPMKAATAEEWLEGHQPARVVNG